MRSRVSWPLVAVAIITLTTGCFAQDTRAVQATPSPALLILSKQDRT